MSDMNVNQLLAEMRRVAAQSEMGFAKPLPPDATGSQSVSFSTILKDSVDKVNEIQQTSASLATAFENGDKNINLAEVMIANQKAGVAFQAMVQVRNRLVQAYQDVMNMPI